MRQAFNSLPRTQPKNVQRDAESLILRDLIDVLCAEDAFAILDRGELCDSLADVDLPAAFTLEVDEQYLRLDVGGRVLLARIRQHSLLQPYVFSRPPVMVRDHTGEQQSWRAIGPIDVARILAESLSPEERAALPNLQGFLADLEAALAHTTILLTTAPDTIAALEVPQPTLLHWERLAALRDRPFHPTARAKSGWSTPDYQQFGPLPATTFGLDWIAVRRDMLQCSPSAETCDIAAELLDAADRERLAAGYSAAELGRAEYLPLPVHPWQMNQVLPVLYAAELANKTCVPLARGLGSFTTTSSARSLVHMTRSALHVKLPLGISSLGALRLLPPRYLHNGERSQGLLEHLSAIDPAIGGRLWLCDERRWWAFADPQADPFADKPGQLACLLRSYPQELLADPAVQLIPMAALSVGTPDGRVPAVDYLLHIRCGRTAHESQVLEVFHEVAYHLIDVALRCFQHGVMPELHGQNVMLVVHSGQIAGLLLRDHDTVRLHLPWMARTGLANPEYIVKPGTPNSLINATPEMLLIYFQTLAVQVNLHAIAVACAEAYGIDHLRFWRSIRESIAAVLADLPEPARIVGQHTLLHQPTWPIKLLLTPLLQRVGTGGGSMPSGIGTIPNPLHRVPVAVPDLASMSEL